VGFISGGWLERSQDGFEVSEIILVSMVTNQSDQTYSVTIKPPPPRRGWCEEHSDMMFMVGGCV